MNAFLRPLLAIATLLLLFVSTESVAGPRRSLFGGGAPTRYSLVEEYKGAYSRPQRKLFGKRKAVSRKAARTHHVSRW